MKENLNPIIRSFLTKTMTDNWHMNNNRKDETSLQTLKATDTIVDRKPNPIEESTTRIEDKRKDFTKERSTIESVRDVMNMIDSGKDSLIDNDNNRLTNSKVIDRTISITYKDKEKDELKRETSLIGIMHEEKKRQNINNIKDKEIIKKGMVKR